MSALLVCALITVGLVTYGDVSVNDDGCMFSFENIIYIAIIYVTAKFETLRLER